MNEPLDELYFKWLYSQVGPITLRNPSRTHWSLLRLMHQTEFVWIIPNDDNRVEDGRELRGAFLDTNDIQGADENWLLEGCSILEMMIGLCGRLSFEADGEPAAWFWELINNLGIDICDRIWGPREESEVGDVLQNLVYRQYHYNGRGGLFPLEEPHEDQTDVEIWYQLNSYLLERIS